MTLRPLAPGFDRLKKDVKLGPGETLGFKNGAYYAKPKPKPPRLAAGARKPSYTVEQQASRDVSRAYEPQIAALTDSIMARAKAGMGAIQGYGSQLAQALSGGSQAMGDIYGAAQQKQAAADAALTGGLRTSTNTEADALATRLGAIGGPTTHADQGRDTGMGAAGALAGMGSASLSQLISEGAGQQAYARKLPDIARLSGLQSARELELSSTRDLADRTGEIRARIPGAVIERQQQIRGNIDSREQQRYERAQDARAQAFEEAIAREQRLLDWQKYQSGLTEDEQDRSAPNASLSSKFGYIVDSMGRPVLGADGQRQPVYRAPAKPKAPKDKSDLFYGARDKAFEAAATMVGANAKVTPKAIHAALFARYGTELVGRGFTRAQVNRMIANAIRYGKANPKVKTSSGSISAGDLKG
jgi:hypothetical protein